MQPPDTSRLLAVNSGSRYATDAARGSHPPALKRNANGQQPVFRYTSHPRLYVSPASRGGHAKPGWRERDRRGRANKRIPRLSQNSAASSSIIVRSLIPRVTRVAYSLGPRPTKYNRQQHTSSNNRQNSLSERDRASQPRREQPTKKNNLYIFHIIQQ